MRLKSHVTCFSCMEAFTCSNCIFSPGDVAGQFTPAPPTCPDDTITFTCTVNGSMFGTTLWRVASSTRFCSLPHISTGTIGQCGPGSLYTATPGNGFGDENATSFTSTLSARADSNLNGILVECFGPVSSTAPGNMVGSSNIQIIGTCTSCYRYTCCMSIHVHERARISPVIFS